MNSITLNGVSSTTIKGLLIQSLPPISKPAIRVQVEEIDGRDGDIVTDLGYQAYDKSFMIGLYGAYDVDQVIAFFASSGEVIFSNEPDKVYRYKTISAIDFERLIRFKQATVTLHVQPYKTSASETPESVESSSFMDSEPYLFRQTPDGANMEIDEIVGGSIVWNQLTDSYNQGSFKWSTGGGATGSYADGIYTFTASAQWGHAYMRFPITESHKYLLHVEIKATSNGDKIRTDVYGGLPRTYGENTTEWQSLDSLASATRTGDTRLRVSDSRTEGWDAVQCRNIMVFDLTLMFGSTIADYIYSLEQASAGAGVAFFRSLFNKSYYPYNAGEIVSVNTSAHKMVGKNNFGGMPLAEAVRDASNTSVINAQDGYVTYDRQKGSEVRTIYDRFEVGKRYTFFLTLRAETTTQNTSMRLEYTDGSATIIRANSQEKSLFYFISDAGKNVDSLVMNFYTAGMAELYYNESGIFEGVLTQDDFEPYTEGLYPLSSIDLRGIPTISDGKLMYDGDVYKADGTVTRKYQLDDLASITWTKRVTGTVNDGYSGVLTSEYTSRNYNYFPPFICDKYRINGSTNASLMVTDVDTMEVGLYGFRYAGNTKVIYAVVPTGTSISGNLLYTLAKPTTETADPYTNPQVCYPDGTEEYIDERDVPVPVGHNTKYIVPIDVPVTNVGNTNSEPIMTIEGSGTINVSVNGSQIFTIDMGDIGEITIDAEALEAYSGSTLMNRRVTGDYSNFVLHPGENIIEVSGDASNVTIERYSRWI